MALFGKKKKAEEAKNEEIKAEETKSESTLDMIKEVMEEAKEARYASPEVTENGDENITVPNTEDVATMPDKPESDVPSAEEIRKAQEVLRRAGVMPGQVTTHKLGFNAPVNPQNLKAVVGKFVADRSQENLAQVLECLKNPRTMVCVPAQIITSKENQEKMKQGGQVKLEGPVHINPLLLTDNEGRKVFPLFSSEETIPDDIKSKSPKVNMPMANCLNILKNIKDVNTFALDPFTANVRINVEIKENPQAAKSNNK